jgi:hypothetical protein
MKNLYLDKKKKSSSENNLVTDNEHILLEIK